MSFKITIVTANSSFSIQPVSNFEDLWATPPVGSQVEIPFSGTFPSEAHFHEVLVENPEGKVLRLVAATVTSSHKSGLSWLLKGTVADCAAT